MKFPKSIAVRFLTISILAVLLLLGVTVLSQSPEPEAQVFSIDPPDQAWVDKSLAELTLREKIGQLIHVRVRGEFLNRKSPAFKELKEELDLNRVGGVVLFAGNIYESSLLLNELQSYSKLPLLVSADFERGASFRIEDTTSFPYTMAIGATGSEEFARQQGRITAQESRALGVHWIFAPVMDVNNNPDNPVINIRSFGEDPQLVARMGSAFIRGAREAGVLTTAKHFPGHGDTDTDTHIGLAVVPSDLERLNSVELVPFKSAIEAGVDSVMTAHVAVPEVTGEPEIPATLSREILTDLLRNTLQFKGLVVTDAMEMGGIKNKYWCGLAAVRAIQAGSDIVLLPTDAGVAINEIERAVNRGDIPLERIDTSVKKVLEAKSSLGLHRNRTVSIERLGETIASPENEALAQTIADNSITAVKDESVLLPVNPVDNPQIFSLVLDSGLATAPGLGFRSEMRTIYPSMRSEWANVQVTEDQIKSIERNASRSDLIVLSTFARLSSGGNTSSLPKNQQTIIKKLLNTGKPLIWIAFGNPYVLEAFPKVGTYLCTFSYSDVSQRAAAKAVSGAIPITGKMPISIPKLASVGEGLQLPKLEMVLELAPAETPNTSSNTFNNTRNLLSSYIKSGKYTRTQLLVGHQGSSALNLTTTDNEGNSSIPIWTSSNHFGVIISAMLATESGSLLLDAPVKDYLPEYRNTEVGPIPISDLLADISGKNQTRISNRALIEEIVSRTTALSLDQVLTKYLLFPLGLRPGEKPTTLLSGLPNIPQRAYYTAVDIAISSQTLLNEGIYNHTRIFKPETIRLFTNPWGSREPLGWTKSDKNDWTGRLFSTKSFGYMDTDGQLLWIDPEKELFIILLASVEENADKSSVEEAYEKITQSILDEIKTE